MIEGVIMKTEHSGAKHGNGAWWGRKAEAKRKSNSHRRLEDDRLVRLAMGDHEAFDILVREAEQIDARAAEIDASIEAGARRSGHRFVP